MIRNSAERAVEIELGDGEIGSFRFPGTLKDETLEQVLYAIQATVPIDYQIYANRIVLIQNSTLRKQYDQVLKEDSYP